MITQIVGLAMILSFLGAIFWVCAKDVGFKTALFIFSGATILATWVCVAVSGLLTGGN